MDKGELLRQVNEVAAKLGLQPIKERVLNDWIDEGLVGGANARGRKRGLNPKWEYGADAVDRATIILESRAMGARRYAEYRLCLWARGCDLPWQEVRTALLGEFRRSNRRRRRASLFQYDHRDNRNYPEKTVSANLKRLGKLDERLASLNFDLSPQSLLQMTSVLTWGKGEHEGISEIAERTFPPGLLGSPDEIESSGEEQLKQVNEADLENARKRFFEYMCCLIYVPLIFSLFNVPHDHEFSIAFRLAACSMMRPEWLVHNLASFTISAYRERTSSIGGTKTRGASGDDPSEHR